MMDAVEFEFEGARNCQGIVLQHIEQGRLSWANTVKLVELRRTYAQRRFAPVESGSKNGTGQRPLFCLKFQDERCTYSGDHQTTRG